MLNALQVGRPDYTVQCVSDIEKPWENPDNYEFNGDTTDEMHTSESSWEEGFMFAANIKQKATKSKKVGFDEYVVDSSNAESENTGSGHHGIDVEQAMRELKQLTEEAEEEKRRLDFNASRVSSLQEKDLRMRKSATAVRRKSSVSATLMDRRPTVTATTSNEGDKDNKTDQVTI